LSLTLTIGFPFGQQTARPDADTEHGVSTVSVTNLLIIIIIAYYIYSQRRTVGMGHSR